MTAVITELTEIHMAVTEFDFISCDDCGKRSPFLDDGDEGTHDASDAGWHVLNLDECGCPNRCRDCADDWCGHPDTTPRLLGMRVI
ncbi:hypothetical protein AB0H73_38060 [Streptomyces olivoreticuli]